ncbi:hypothetical protein Q6D67_12065 [Haliea sp. E1-2-M8]|uniref:hypothetical protein n=1 Tax=Haliea sp. E1-2-M8 TaxID=3064706 RepID=UPI00272801F1|nr:hypothetical protein [Haliea sp. E1-2-M8]MDO8862436.1 hypothetical protein [Haliea sp. E1-2-M8]
MPLLEGLHPVGLALATLLPWLAGCGAVRCWLGPVPTTLLLGHGYLLGQLLAVLLLLTWDALGFTLAWWPLATALAAFGAGLWALSLRRHPAHWRPTVCLSPADLLWLLPLAWFLWSRGSVLVAELALRPLFAWDAWMNWVPRAVVWFEHGSLTEFVLPPAWLAAAPGSELYTLGNWRAGAYPPGVPLLLLWQMLGAGTFDHTLLYLPWLLLAAACALALWGHLRLVGLGRVPTAIAVYLLLSMPLLTTHAVLPGYADLWLGVCFTLGAMALAQWQHSGERRYAGLALALALFCTLLKTPGTGFALLLVLATLLFWWRPPAAWVRATVLGGLLLLLAGLLAGLNPELVRYLQEQPVLALPGHLPALKLQLSPLLPYLGQTFFVYDNWHLLGVLLLAALLARVLACGPASLNSIALLLLTGGAVVLALVFGFTQYGQRLEQGITFHRSFLYLTPLAVFVAFACLQPLLPRAAAGRAQE